VSTEDINSDSPKPTDATVVLSAKEIQALGISRRSVEKAVEKTQAVVPSIVEANDESHLLLAQGTKLAEFEITGVIGQGGFGIVYQARDSSLERDVAIKEYLPSSLAMRTREGNVTARSPQNEESFSIGLKSFVNEARLLAQFDHPSLLKVYRFWDERGTTYMVMPLYRGQTLKQVLAKKEVLVDEAWLLRTLDGVTQALALIHSADCYHRDIAPDNIMLVGDDFHPVVLDFGAARRVISGMTQALTVILKPGYAPVEQYADSPDFKQGPWTDIYALGAVMHVAIAAKPPPPSVTRLLSDSYKRLIDDTDLRAKFSEGFLSAIDAALSVRPEDRPQSIAQFRSLLGLSGPNQGVFSNADGTIQISAKPAVKLVGSVEARASKRRGVASLIPSITGAISIALLAVVGYAWWAKSTKNTASDIAQTTVQSAPASSSAASAPVVAAAPVISAAPSVVPATVTSPAALFESIQSAAAAEWKVNATVRSATVKIANKEKLEFSIQSAAEGFVYVYLLSSGGELLQLFPNQLDKRNRIKANETLKLPRASWPMEAGGPPGTNRFVSVVSAAERDFSASGLVNDGVFGRFSFDAITALERAKSPGSQPVISGKPKCASDAVCDTRFGAASFSISEE
jgi:serine/threonine protein kinase